LLDPSTWTLSVRQLNGLLPVLQPPVDNTAVGLPTRGKVPKGTLGVWAISSKDQMSTGGGSMENGIEDAQKAGRRVSGSSYLARTPLIVVSLSQ
jgi:hypothetical protein